MSERTRCNYCTLEAIKKNEQGKKVEIKRDNTNGWLRVFVDDKPYGVSFMKLTDHCVC